MSRELPTHDELARILSYLPNNDRDTWFSVFCIVGRAYNCDEGAYEVARQWAASFPNRTAADEIKERYEFESSSRRNGPGIGALIVKAKSNGYEVPKQLRSLEAEVLAPAAASLADNTAVMLREVPVTKENVGSPEAVMYREVQELGAQVLKYWLLEAPDEESGARLAFLAENSKRFRFLCPRHRVVAGALYDYCATHTDDKFVYVDFLNWCKIVGLDSITEDRLSSIIAANTIHNSATAIKAMDELCDKAWMIYVCQQADLLRTCLQDGNLEAMRQARAAFIRTSEPVSTLECNPFSASPRRVRNNVADMIDPTAKLRLFVPSGYPVLDKFTHGYCRGEVTIFAAHSGVGKTWFGVDSAYRLIKEQHGRVLFFSTEMSAAAIELRFFAVVNNCKIDPESLANANNDGSLNQLHQNYSQFVKAHSGIEGANRTAFGLDELHVYEAKKGGLTLSSIKETMAVEAQAGPIDLVVVDYLQNVVNDNLPRTASRYDRVLDVMTTLDQLSSDYNCATLALAQLNNPNRKQGTDTKPNLYDIAECTYVVQPAAAVIMMFRDGNGTTQAQPAPWGDDTPAMSETPLKVMVTKSRYGSLNEKPLRTQRSVGSRFDFLE